MAFAFPNPSYLLLLLLVVLLFFTGTQAYMNISLGSSLSTLNHNASWISLSGEFAFGFQQIGNDGFLLAIWFHKVPETTIVWSANRNNLAPEGSNLELTTDGQLVLYDPTGTRIWSPQVTGNGVAYAAMLDSGNLVLATNDSDYLWKSFDQPTDTLLPTQIMNQDTKLVARYLDSDYKDGRFFLTLQKDGNLFMYTAHYPLDAPNFAYWSTQNSIDSGYQMIFNQSGSLYLIDRNGTILDMVLQYEISPKDFYQRATVDADGVFRHYVYPRGGAADAGKWKKAWTATSFIPSNICTGIRANTGGGACGFNSYCMLGSDQKPSCLCPEGYKFMDPDDVRRGCMPNFVQQSCEDASKEANLFDYVAKTNTDWPLSDYEHFEQISEDWCRKECLADCLCDVAIYRDGNCWKKKLPLSNGRMDPSTGGTALIKVRKVNSNLPPSPKQKDQSTLILIGSVLLGSSVFLNFLLFVATLLLFSHFYQRRPKMVQAYSDTPTSVLQRFSYSEMERATSGFKEELGRGAFGTVYKGALEFESTQVVAVKKLEKKVGEGEQEFKAELNAIGRTNHKNLVKLIGFCQEGEHRLLVYEYMRNGSLAELLFGNSRPEWNGRLQIAFGTARGLLYLHEECSSQIIHCDIKPQNILLDDSLMARISDFGLAKLLKTDQTRTTTAIRGTKGYVAPEWFRNCPVTAKVDVYSFGILLLEIICCRKNFKMEVGQDNQKVLADWACDCLKEGNLELLVENDEEAKNDIRRVEKFVMIAMWCIQEDPSMRPTMKMVTQMMEGSVQVPIPPDPLSFISTSI